MYGIAQCLMVGCGQGCFYICTGPMQSDWFPKKRGVVNGISTIGANLATAILSPLMIFLLAIGGYKVSMSVFAIAGILLAVYALITLRDNPLDAGMYPDNVTKDVYEAEYKGLENKDSYVTDWTVGKILTNGDAWLVTIVPGFIALGLLGIITQFVPRNIALGLSQEVAVGAMTVAGLVGIIGSYVIGFIDTRMGTKHACMIYCGIFATGVLFNLLASVWQPFVYVSILIVGFSLGGCTNMNLSFPASIFGPLDYSRILRVTFPINYCISCLNFVLNGIVLKLTGSLTGAYIVYLGLFILNIILVGVFAEEGKWDKLKHPELRQKTA
jgi:sugar phosphate permease